MDAVKSAVILVLTWQARLVLWRWEPKVIAVTGSVGKTTTKDAIYAGIVGTLHVRKSAKSFNTAIGVPLTILGLDNAWNNPLLWLFNIVRGFLPLLQRAGYPEWLVLEVGADRPGDIRSIARWLRPDIVVFTGVPEVPTHIEYFDSTEELVKEKKSLAKKLKPGGKLILNGDDPRTRDLKNDFRGASVTYGFNANDDFTASHEEVMYVEGMPTGLRFRAERAGASIPVTVHGALGRPRVYAGLAALAVGEEVGMDLVSVSQNLLAWEPPPGRVRILKGINGSVIIDDTYNSSPTAAFAALETLQNINATRRIAVLGDMLELGKYSTDQHQKLGVYAAHCAEILYTVGFRSKATAESAHQNGMPKESIRIYEMKEAERAGTDLRNELKEGDVVLVKGSQGIRMERTVRAIMAEPNQAEELLVRMDAEWQNR